MKWTSWVTAGALIGVGSLVVVSSLHTGRIRCEVCMEFGGRRACRAVDGPTEDDARMAAITNACALLASGVTDTVACQGRPPASLSCREAAAPTS